MALVAHTMVFGAELEDQNQEIKKNFILKLNQVY